MAAIVDRRPDSSLAAVFMVGAACGEASMVSCGFVGGLHARVVAWSFGGGVGGGGTEPGTVGEVSPVMPAPESKMEAGT
jgi:hypothetical protein